MIAAVRRQQPHNPDQKDAQRPGRRERAAFPCLFGVAGLLAVTLLACAPHKRLNPDYCDPTAVNSCGAGAICASASYRCVPVDDGGTGDGMQAADGGNATADADGAVDQSSAGDAAIETGPSDGGASDGSDGAPRCPVCSGATPVCNQSTGRCTACAMDNQCALIDPAAPLCVTGGGACVACNVDGDCAGPPGTKRLCFTNHQCVACRTSADCPVGAPVCDSAHQCAPCTMDVQCSGTRPTVPLCRVSDGTCVECASDADCKSVSKPICGANNVCKPCVSDRECVAKQGPNPGVCMSHTDGHCATDAQVLYVKPASGCSDAADAGTAAVPFCAMNAALAVEAVRQKPVIVIRPGAPIAVAPWSYDAIAGLNELTVIGQDGATVGPGTDVGIVVNSGNIYIRGLRVTGMLKAGISVRPGKNTVRLNRCMITGNTGGLFVNGAGFEITNSVFATNTLVSVDNPGAAPIEYAGAYLGGVLGSPAVFRNNTVYANGGPGVVCASAYQLKNVLVAGNVGAQVSTCTLDLASQVPMTNAPFDPKFDANDPKNPYRLTAGSPCVDFGPIGVTDGPPDDIEGNPRPSPAGGVSDCGAYEFQP